MVVCFYFVLVGPGFQDIVVVVGCWLLVVGCWLLVVVAVAVVLSKPNTHEHIYLHNMTSIEM